MLRAALAADFLKILDDTIASVQDNPLQFSTIHGEARRVLIRRLPYSIIYTVSDQEIIVRHASTPVAIQTLAFPKLMCRQCGRTACVVVRQASGKRVV